MKARGDLFWVPAFPGTFPARVGYITDILGPVGLYVGPPGPTVRMVRETYYVVSMFDDNQEYVVNELGRYCVGSET